MKIPTRLLTAAKVATATFAFALMVATPAAQSALAAGDQPPAPTTPVPQPPVHTMKPDLKVATAGINTHTDDGHFLYWFMIKNIGDAPSKPMLVHTYCGYMMPGNYVQEVAAAPVQLFQGLAPQGLHDQKLVDCARRNGQSAVSVRVLVTSEGDADTSNNQKRVPN